MECRFIQYFEDSFKRNWDLPAMTNYATRQTYAYKDVAREIARLHILFQELDIQQDDKIALVGDNTPEWAIAFLATITYGAVIVPILQNFHPDDITYVISHSESKLLFVEDSYWDRLEEKDTSGLRAVFSLSDFRCMRQTKGETLHEVMRQLPTLFKNRYPNGFQHEDVHFAKKDDQKMCVLNYTSGTTGYSKGVMLTGDNFLSILENINSHGYCVSGDRFLVLLPLSHMYGCFFYIILPISNGARVWFLSTFPNSNTLRNSLAEIKPSSIIVVPLVVEVVYQKKILPFLNKPYVKIIKHIPILSEYVYSKIREQFIGFFGKEYKNLFLGGASLNPEVEEFLLKAKIPYHVGYGMTECTASITLDYEGSTVYSVGKKVKGTAIEIDSPNPRKIAGEILVKGRNVMMGYYHDEEATKKVFTEDGWFRTGDLGVIDKEGNLYIKGRLKSMILTSSGQNIYPEEIESKLNKSVYIAESLVLQRGEKIVALIVPNKEFMSNNPNLQSIIEAHIKEVNKQLPAYAFIHSFELQSSAFEKTPKQSIKRYLYQ